MFYPAFFHKKNRRISFHKSADFLNAFFHSYLCPPAFRYFLSFIPPFSVLFRPPFLRLFLKPAFFLSSIQKQAAVAFSHFPKRLLWNPLISKKRYCPPLLLQKYNRRPPNSFLRRRNCPQSLFASHRVPPRKSRGKVRPLRLPERRILPCAVCLTINFFRAPSLPENNLKKYFYYILKIC